MRKKSALKVTQETIDAIRKPLTAKEQGVYAKADREWRPGSELGPTVILDSLVEKGWVDETHSVLAGCAVYQRGHSLDS